jgi:glycosyltransferase involved in cell wall biosynthesis
MLIAEYLDIPFTERSGGVGTYIRSVGRELVRSGNTVKIIDGRGKFKLLINRHLLKPLNEANIHHFHEPSTAYPLTFLRASGHLDSVITFHAPVLNNTMKLLYSPTISYLYKKARLVLTTTKRNAEILSSAGITSEVIPLWADEFFKPDKNPYRKKSFILSACVVDDFHTYKNYPEISRLGKALENNFGGRIKLVHVGLRDYDLPYVTHVGIVDRCSLRRLYSDAMTLVLPSIGPYEGFGLVAAEALACGTPVLVSDGCGISEFLDDCFVSSLADFENNLTFMIRELMRSNRSIIDKACSESVKFRYDNCRKTARLILSIDKHFSS